MATITLTASFVKSATCPPDKKKVDFFDHDCKGLMLEVRISGGRTFYLRYADERGKVRQCKLADAADVTLAQARTLADKRRTQIAMGEDPLQRKAELKAIPTVSQFIHERYLPFVKTYKKSWECDRGLLKNHIESVWGDRYLDQITKQDVVALITKHRETHAAGSCNRLLILLRYIFNLAVKWEIPGIKTNPTAGFALLPDANKRERYLTREEAARLYETLLDSENQQLQHIVAMLILTGARKREVLDARWEDFDIERRMWRIPVTKLGKARYVPLSDGALTVLRLMPHRPKCPWVFPNPDTGKPFVSIFFAWNTARKQAGLADVRLHDLRHSFASFLINAGRSLYEVQRLLGHTQVRTTQRYAHLSQESLLSAANAATEAAALPLHKYVDPATAAAAALEALESESSPLIGI